MPFEYIVSLPNEKRVKVILDEQCRHNYISQSLVDLLLKTGEIVVEGDQAFVEFHRLLTGGIPKKTVRYFDGAWCYIISAGPYIKLGQEWMIKRQVTIESDQSSCVVRPSHLPGQFRFPKYVSTRTNPPIQHVIYEADPALADLYEEQTRAFDLLQDTWDQSLLVASELDLIDDSILTADSTFVSTLPVVLVDAWEQNLFINSGLDLIDDSVLTAGSTFVALVDALSDAMLFQESPLVDTIWLDFCDAHVDRQSEVLGMIVCVELHARFLALVFIILRHFKIRGRIFSNRGRMMGIEMHGTRGARLGTPDTGRRTQLTEDEQRRWCHAFVLLSLCCNKAQMRTI